MDLYPRFRFRPRLLGEARIYDLLSAIDESAGFSVHSVNLPEHAYKRWGEADFVVVSPAGLILLEVKGGTVYLTGRVWRYENARGQAIESSEGPARQAISAAAALENLLQKRMGKKIRCRWGVTFPLCTFNRVLDELPPARLADQNACSTPDTFLQWLNGIPFDQHQPEEFALSEKDMAEIREILLPEFSASSSLGLSVAGVENGIVKLTRQQYGILESLSTNPRLTVTGGAGTGKTELAVLCARAELAAGRRPAILTRGTSLLMNLRSRLAQTGIPVAADRMPPGTDVLIIDEGQDFAQPGTLDHIFSDLPGGMAHGRWRWFMDPNLQYLDTPPNSHCLSRIHEHSVSVTLSRNVRSTQEIVRSIQAFLAADIGLSSIDGYGVRVGFHETSNVEEQAESAVELVRSFIENGVRAEEIAVLGPAGKLGPVISRIAGQLPEILRPMNEDGSFASRSHGVIARIIDFRGLEARAVILADLEGAADAAEFERNLYVGMTRSSAALHIFVSESTRARMVALLEKNS